MNDETCTFCVIDTGCGISESYLALLNNDVNIPSSQEETAEGAVRILSMMGSSESENVSIRIFPISIYSLFASSIKSSLNFKYENCPLM